MVISGLTKEKIDKFREVLTHWKGYYFIGVSMYDGLYNITIECQVPITLKYFAGDGANNIYVSIWCGDKVLSLTNQDYLSIEL